MIPPDIDKYNHLFDTALKGRSLEADTFGFGAAKDKALNEMMPMENMPAPDSSGPYVGGKYGTLS